MLDAAKIAQLAQMARSTLSAFGPEHAEPDSSWLRPRPADYSTAFGEELGAKAQAVYEPLWANATPIPRGRDHQTELRIFLATTEDLQAGNERAQAFPGGYKSIAEHLAPRRLWVRWRWVEPGQTSGMAFDGLVWLDDHWAWFPKPWRALQAPQR